MRPYLPTENAAVIEALKGLIDRLSDPNLTVAEAQELQPRLLRLLAAIEGETHPRAVAGDRKKTGCEPGRCVTV